MSRVNTNVYFIALLILCQQAVVAEETEQPSMELLEFLGGAEMTDGVWVDPLDMMDLLTADLQGKQPEEQDND